MIAGAALGAANSATNVFGSPYGPFTRVRGEGVGWLQFSSLVLGSLWFWALFPFAVGWAGKKAARGIVGGTCGIITALLAYYVTDNVLGATNGVEILALRGWLPMALLGAPVMALLGAYARGLRFEHFLAGLIAPLVMAHVTSRSWRPSGVAQPWVGIFTMTAAAVITALLWVRFFRAWRARLGSGREHASEDTGHNAGLG